jgi:hypothetical protein
LHGRYNGPHLKTGRIESKSPKGKAGRMREDRRQFIIGGLEGQAAFYYLVANRRHPDGRRFADRVLYGYGRNKA